MGLYERLAELGKALLTTEAELKHLRETLKLAEARLSRLLPPSQPPPLPPGPES